MLDEAITWGDLVYGLGIACVAIAVSVAALAVYAYVKGWWS